MRNSLSCRDLGDYSCGFEAKSDNDKEIIDAMIKHTTKYHAEKIADLSEEEKKEFIARLTNKIN